MSVSASGGGTPDIVNLLMMRKAMSAEQTKSADLLQMLPPSPPPPPPAPRPPAPAQRTWYL